MFTRIFTMFSGVYTEKVSAIAFAVGIVITLCIISISLTNFCLSEEIKQYINYLHRAKVIAIWRFIFAILLLLNSIMSVTVLSFIKRPILLLILVIAWFSWSLLRLAFSIHEYGKERRPWERKKFEE